MNEAPFRVLIADTHCEISMEMPYLFHRAGCEVHVFCPRGSWLLRNRYWDRWFEASRKEEAIYAAELAELVKAQKYDWVVLGDDDAIRFANRGIRDASLACKVLPLSRLEYRYMLGSKAGLSRACERSGILSPSYRIYEAGKSPEVLVRGLSYPLLLKVDESSGGEGVLFCKDLPALQENLGRIPSRQLQGLVFQEYIEGDNVAVEALYREGFLLAYAYSEVIHTAAGEFSVSLERRYLEWPAIEAELSHIGQALGLNGFSTMTFIRERRGGRHFLIEADMRPQAWFRLAFHCGVDFSQAIQNYLSGKKILLRPRLPAGRSSLILRHYARHLSWCLREGKLRQLFYWLSNRDGRWRDIPSYDLRTWAATHAGILRRGIAFAYKRLSSPSRNY